MTKISKHSLAFLFAVGFTCIGCNDSNIASRSSQAITSGSAQVRLVHASPTTAAVDIYIDSATAPAFANIAFGQATPYLSVPAGSFSFVVRAAGAAPTAAPLFTSDPIAAADGQTITAVAGGQLKAVQAKALFRIVPFVEAFTPGCSEARLRLVNLDYSLTAMGIDVGDDGIVEETNVGLYEVSAPAGVAAPIGHSLQVALQKAAPVPAGRLTAFTLGGELLHGGGTLFVIAAGLKSFTPRDLRGLELLVVDASSNATLIKQNPSLYLLNLIPDITSLDLFVAQHGLGEPKTVTSLPFGGLSAPIQVPPHVHGQRFTLDETSAALQPVEGGIYADRTDQLLGGERYLMVASGFAKRGEGTVEVQLYRDGFPTNIAATGIIRGVAAAQDAPPLDIGRFAPGAGTPFSELATDFDNLIYLASSGENGVSLTSAPLGPGVRQTGTTTAKRFKFGQVTDHAFGLVGGAWAPQSPSEQPISFVVVDVANSGAWTSAIAPLVP
jgi:hypothetical protein